MAGARRPIDPIEHLAKALYFDAWRERGFLVASTVYADASGNDHSEPITLVAGWWNSVDNWVEFGREWNAFLRRHDISCLHQTKSKKRPQDDWWKADIKTRNTVLGDASGIIQRSGGISFAFFTPTDDWNEYLATTVPEQIGGPTHRPECFEWNGFRFVAQVERWCLYGHIPMPEFIFESSNKREQAALEGVLERYELPQPVFRSKLEEDPARTVVALQAADFLAYEIYKGWKDLMRDGATSRPFLLEFARLENHWGWADKDKMDKLIPMSRAQNHLSGIAQQGRKERGESS
ncbi:MAG: hypothetical protein M3Q55_07100 [Acidobacteriota bacterium]|nr:hypothetical protein [Acidobacteriota bacterium]